MGLELTALNITDAYLTVLSRHVLTVLGFQILIKSCCIESRNDPSPKSEVVRETKVNLKISYSTDVCLAQLDRHQICKPVMVSVVSSSPTGGNFIFLRHLNVNFVQKCQICVIYVNLDYGEPRTELFGLCRIKFKFITVFVMY